MKKIKILSILIIVAFFGLVTFDSVSAVPCEGSCRAVTCLNGEGEGAGSCVAPDLCCVSFGLPDRTLYEVLADTANFLLSLAGILALLGFVISGFQYFLAASDEKAAEKAKKIMTGSIIGLVMILASLVVIYAVTDIFY